MQKRLVTAEPELPFAQMLELLPDGVMYYQAVRDQSGQLIDFRLSYVNRQFIQLAPASYQLVVGSCILEDNPDQREALRPLVEKYSYAVETEVITAVEFFDPLLRIKASFRVAKLNDGVLVTIREVDKANSLRLEQQEATLWASLFTTMSQSVPDLGVLVCDPDYRILFANGDLPNIFLKSKTELIGKHLEEIMPFEMASYTRQNFGDALAGRSRYMNEEIADQFYEVFVGPVSDSEGRTVMAVATLRNITSVKQAHQQLESSIQDLKRSNQNLEQFAYIASHDLQEPLRKIQSFGDVLRDQYEAQLGEQGSDIIRRMQTAAVRMSVLIRNLLTYSRVASHKETFKPVDLNLLMTEVMDDLETVIREKQAIILIDSLSTIRGSALQLRQLFQNLLSNSLKFNRAGIIPEIHIRTKIHSGTDLLLMVDATKPATSYVEISVEDNGIGFDPDQADRIFQVFQRLHGRHEFSGTGIGLAIVQKVVENHGGRIQAIAEPEKGARFNLFLPLKE